MKPIVDEDKRCMDRPVRDDRVRVMCAQPCICALSCGSSMPS